MKHKKKKQIILQRRAARRRKNEISAGRRAKARELAKIFRRRAKRRQSTKERFWEKKLGLRPVSRNMIAVKKCSQIFGFFEDPNLQSNPALEYFSDVLNPFEHRLPAKEMFPDLK